MERQVHVDTHRHGTMTSLFSPHLTLLATLIWIRLMTGFAYRPTITWDMPETAWEPRREGEEVYLVCVARDLGAIYAAVSIEKAMPIGSTARGATQVVTNGRVEDNFRNLFYQGQRRYTVHFQKVHHVTGFEATMQLNISHVEAEDAGRFRCKAEGEQTELKTLAIRVPVEDVYMRVFYPNKSSVPIPEMTTVTMREHRRSGFACSVVLRTELIVPEVNISAGGRDVTSLFSVEEPVKLRGPGRQRYMFQFSYFTLRPDPEMHGQDVHCSAYAVGFEGLTSAATINIKVEFRPQIVCQHYENFSPVGGTVTMTCAVKANPEPDVVFRFGYFLSDNVYNISLPSFTDGKYTFTRSPSDKGVTTISFTMVDVRDGHFRYSYKLDAMNAYGSASATLMLYEGVVGGTISAGNHQRPLLYWQLLATILISTWFALCLHT